uniref:Ribosomal L1 domain containing 1 n=1 Tax=Apteryx owenii TaxID=8824 RepID=A0A8B9P2X7_APTOW
KLVLGGNWPGTARAAGAPTATTVRKAVQALLAFARSGAARLLGEGESVFLVVTVWKIPRAQPLPHGIRADGAEVCLFTRDEPGLAAEQTENMYKKLLAQKGVTSVSQIISYKTLRKEYKPFEAKRRLLNRFDLFLSDDRIRRLLPSHLGKHFYRSKKAPLSVNLKASNLAKELHKHIQGTVLPVTNKGCSRIGHTGMKADEILENVIAAAEVIAKKLPKNWKNVKILHLKTVKSVALPIFTAQISNLDELDKEPSVDKQEEEVKNLFELSRETLWNHLFFEYSLCIIVFNMLVLNMLAVDSRHLPEKGDKLGKKTKTRLGKRKTSLPQETPKTKHKVTEERADLQISPKQKQVKQFSMPKEAIKEKELKKTPRKPEAKSFATPKAGKLVQSAKKSSKTPK